MENANHFLLTHPKQLFKKHEKDGVLNIIGSDSYVDYSDSIISDKESPTQ